MANKQIIVDKIYLKDSTLETPSSPEQFQYEQPSIEIQMDCKVGHSLLLPPSYYEVVLDISVIGKTKENYLYVVNTQYGGLFDLKGYTDEERKRAVSVDCPYLLFPYSQRLINDMTTQVGFHPAHIQPINFEGMYEDTET